MKIYMVSLFHRATINKRSAMNETALQVHGYFDVLHTNCTCPSSMKTDVYAYELKRTESEVSLYACSCYFQNYYALTCTCLLHMHYTFFSLLLFSERSRSLYAIARLSVVCNVRAPYLGGSNFRQYFYGIRYPGHPLTSTEKFTEIVSGEPFRRGVKHKRGGQV